MPLTVHISYINLSGLPQPHSFQNTLKATPLPVSTSHLSQKTSAKHWTSRVQPSWRSLVLTVHVLSLNLGKHGTARRPSDSPSHMMESFSTTLLKFLRIIRSNCGAGRCILDNFRCGSETDN